MIIVVLNEQSDWSISGQLYFPIWVDMEISEMSYLGMLGLIGENTSRALHCSIYLKAHLAHYIAQTLSRLWQISYARMAPVTLATLAL